MIRVESVARAAVPCVALGFLALVMFCFLLLGLIQESILYGVGLNELLAHGSHYGECGIEVSLLVMFLEGVPLLVPALLCLRSRAKAALISCPFAFGATVAIPLLYAEAMTMQNADIIAHYPEVTYWSLSYFFSNHYIAPLAIIAIVCVAAVSVKILKAR